MKKRSILTICEHFEEICNADLGPKDIFEIALKGCYLIRILVQGQGGREVSPHGGTSRLIVLYQWVVTGGIRKYFED